jgi:nucleoside 2-deoxyribosyltransferase
MLEIIGGSYYEFCWDPQWDELYGSGLRAAVALSQRQLSLRFHTYADEYTSKTIEVIAAHLGFEVVITLIEQSIEFKYQHPLADPIILSSVGEVPEHRNIILPDAEKILCYGMIEGNALVHGKNVVYDPQSPGNPISFWENGSTTDKLVMVLNYKEASALAGSEDMGAIIACLYDKEKVHSAVIKNGPEGAIAVNHARNRTIIPSFPTDKVWTIGSGDIFTSHFAYSYLIAGMTIEEAALRASIETAWYAQHNTLPVPSPLIGWEPVAFRGNKDKEKKVYIAGPFFTMAERWLINEFRNALLKMGLKVFSPLHDVGIGNPEDVAKPDLEGLIASDIVLAILNGLDSGTLFEIGYAKALNKPVIGFSEKESRESLTMLHGTGCRLSNDFTTVIYQLIWEVYS